MSHIKFYLVIMCMCFSHSKVWLLMTNVVDMRKWWGFNITYLRQFYVLKLQKHAWLKNRNYKSRWITNFICCMIKQLVFSKLIIFKINFIEAVFLYCKNAYITNIVRVAVFLLIWLTLSALKNLAGFLDETRDFKGVGGSNMLIWVTIMGNEYEQLALRTLWNSKLSKDRHKTL